MHTIEATNVRDALPEAVGYLLRHGVLEQTRNGEVLAAPCPVTILYECPKQHVLLNPVRDANPFFHLIESLWMLAGRHDGTFLDTYIRDFSKRFGNNGIIMDAYGYRWRYALRLDQLDLIVAQLRKNPTSRQCVLQMWGAGTNDLMSQSAKPCNLIINFRIFDGALDMTVFNRSNDLIWGCCGANAVQFPILQEYMAARIGVEMGRYWQVSTNLHLYLDHIKMMDKRIENDHGEFTYTSLIDLNDYDEWQQLVQYPLVFDKELINTMKNIESINESGYLDDTDISNSFLRDTVLPMAMAHHYYKNNLITDALDVALHIEAADWRQAVTEWITRHDGIRRRHESAVQPESPAEV